MELTIIIVSLLLTFYFSGTETAFISVNRVRIEVWRRQQSRVADIIARFLKEPERFIYATLVGNNIANVAFASYATLYFNQYMDEKLTWLLITAITVLWGEILPKTLFRSLADWVIRKVAPLLEFFYRLFLPMIWIVRKISELILKMFKHRDKEVRDFFSKKDVEILIRESRNLIKMEENQGEILGRILSLRSLAVRDVMIPRAEIIAISESDSIESLVEVARKTGLTKFPVFRESIDDVIGMVNLKDLFLMPENIKSVLREIMFVPEAKRSIKLLSDFRGRENSMAIVVDEYGGTAGLVTAEDLIEELVGEIEDEYDEAAVLYRKTGKNSYSVNARIELDDLKSLFNIELPEGEYDTLAGFILNYLGHIPKREESFNINGVKYLVTRATRRKVEYVKIIFPDQEPTPG